MNESMNESINDEGVYRTALATPGLLKSVHIGFHTKVLTSTTTPSVTPTEISTSVIQL